MTSLDFETQRAFLLADVGAPGSGAARYAAAMHFFNLGLISADMLEIYRRCSKFDREDPIDLARYERVLVPPISLGPASQVCA